MLYFTLHKTEHVSRDLVTKKPSPSPAIGHSTTSDLSASQGQVFRVFDSPVIDTGMTNPSQMQVASSTGKLCKINFDTSIFVGDNKSGIGVVIRDKNSLVIASCSQVLQHAYSSNEIEALAGSCYCVFQEARIFSLHVWI